MMTIARKEERLVWYSEDELLRFFWAVMKELNEGKVEEAKKSIRNAIETIPKRAKMTD